jgi:hypothetical protein
VLLIDEAYYLYRADSERDYGPEAIEILLQVMQVQRDDLVVILAGYRDRVDSFFTSNPGMASRIAHHIDFPDFTVDELVRIAELMAARRTTIPSRRSPAATAVATISSSSVTRTRIACPPLRDSRPVARLQPSIAGAR